MCKNAIRTNESEGFVFSHVEKIVEDWLIVPKGKGTIAKAIDEFFETKLAIRGDVYVAINITNYDITNSKARFDIYRSEELCRDGASPMPYGVSIIGIDGCYKYILDHGIKDCSVVHPSRIISKFDNLIDIYRQRGDEYIIACYRCFRIQYTQKDIEDENLVISSRYRCEFCGKDLSKILLQRRED